MFQWAIDLCWDTEADYIYIFEWDIKYMDFGVEHLSVFVVLEYNIDLSLDGGVENRFILGWFINLCLDKKKTRSMLG